MKDYYELLEVNKSASDDTIKKVFRMLIKKNHPDLFEGKEKQEAEERVKKINEAYAILGDKKEREIYDAKLEESSKNTSLEMEALIAENEYLKTVIEEKNHILREYLDESQLEELDLGLYDDIDRDINKEMQERDEQITNEAYELFEKKQKMRKILFSIGLFLVMMIAFSISTGVNMFAVIFRVLGAIFGIK